MMDLGLNGKKALVTGASSGLGAAIAMELAAEGASVVINSRSRERLEETAETISTATGNRPDILVADLSNLTDLNELAKNAKVMKIDIFVSNSGGPPPGQITDLPAQAWGEASDLLLRPAVTITRALLAGMKERRYGRLIYVTSIAVLQPVNSLALSNTYRAAVTGFCKTVSNNYAKHGITSNCVCPGYTATERLKDLAKELAESGGKSVDEVYGEFAEDTAVGRVGEPEELAAVVAFLAGERASYITGSSIAVAGGSNRALI